MKAKKSHKKIINRLKAIIEVLKDAAINQLSKPYEMQEKANKIIDKGLVK